MNSILEAYYAAHLVLADQKWAIVSLDEIELSRFSSN